ncbi:hypothetical protein BTVI_31275 [Pitangus sulphuratus]|nr:hypothetical protein BTVI_31275 [Pitangus sulphuratus]
MSAQGKFKKDKEIIADYEAQVKAEAVEADTAEWRCLWQDKQESSAFLLKKEKLAKRVAKGHAVSLLQDLPLLIRVPGSTGQDGFVSQTVGSWGCAFLPRRGRGSWSSGVKLISVA